MLIKPAPMAKKIYFSIFVFLAVFILSVPAKVFAGGVVAIVNKANPVASLSISDLQELFKGKKKEWDNGEPVVLYLPPASSEAMTSLAKNVFKKNGAAGVSKFYLKAIFQQKFTDPPESSGNAGDSVANVSGDPGAITLIEADKASGDVKVIKVGGL